MDKRRKHTLESCKVVAAQHSTRSQLKKKNHKVYAAAAHNGWLDLLYPPADTPAKAEPWTRERVAEVSKLYATRTEMGEGAHQWALKVAREKGWEDVLPPVREIQPAGYWTKERVKEIAQNCLTWSEFWKIKGASTAAWRNGWFEDACGHLIQSDNKTDNDCFYMWQAHGMPFNGLPVYKVGITSLRLGHSRIKRVAKEIGCPAELIFFECVPDARAIEKLALSIGHNPQYVGFDGCSEFRAYSQQHIAQIIAALNLAGVVIL